MKRNTLYLLVAVLLIAAGGLFFLSTQKDPDVTELGSTSAPTVETDDANAPMVEVKEFTLGDENAPVTMIEYASFTCPHCAAFHAGAFQNIKEDYIDTGKVKFVNREVYFDRYGLWAGMLARCGDGEKYFGIADILFRTQQDWATGSSDAEVEENLYGIGRIAGFSDEQMKACLGDSAKAQALVATYQKNAEADGITGTPSFVINGKSQKNAPYDDLKAVIDAALAE